MTSSWAHQRWVEHWFCLTSFIYLVLTNWCMYHFVCSTAESIAEDLANHFCFLDTFNRISNHHLVKLCYTGNDPVNKAKFLFGFFCFFYRQGSCNFFIRFLIRVTVILMMRHTCNVSLCLFPSSSRISCSLHKPNPKCAHVGYKERGELDRKNRRNIPVDRLVSTAVWLYITRRSHFHQDLFIFFPPSLLFLKSIMGMSSEKLKVVSGGRGMYKSRPVDYSRMKSSETYAMRYPQSFFLFFLHPPLRQVDEGTRIFVRPPRQIRPWDTHSRATLNMKENATKRK